MLPPAFSRLRKQLFGYPLRRIKQPRHFRLVASLLAGAAMALSASTALGQWLPDKEWDRVYGGYETERLNVVIPTADGGYLLGQHSQSGAGGTRTQPSQGEADYFIVKIGPNGVKQWDRRYGGTGQDNITCIKQAPDGGYFLGGTTCSEKSGDVSRPHVGHLVQGESIEDFWVVRIDAQGNKLWDQRAGGVAYDMARAMCLTPDGGVLVVGSSSSNFQQVFDFYLVKFNSEGIVEWEEKFGGPDEDQAFDIQPTADGGYLLAGYSDSPPGAHKTYSSQGKHDYWLVKVSADGKRQWDRGYGGNDVEHLTSLTPISDGGWLLGGSSSSGVSGDKTEPSRGNTDYWVVRLDAQYNKVWDKTLGGTGDDRLTTVALTPGNGWLLGGTTSSETSGDKTQAPRGMRDYWVVSLAPQGTKRWDARYGGDYDELMTGILTTPDNGILLSGTSLSARSGDKSINNIGLGSGWLVKLSGGGFVTSTRASHHEANAWQAYPNPAQKRLYVRKAHGSAGPVTLELRDPTGRLLRQLTTPASSLVPAEIPLTDLGPGMYLVQIRSADAPAQTLRVTVQ
ncbi:hypothetical protein HNQ93_003792 [Hymenobacter luteus]|uniref:T9SS type A sorting domain-containing protein n=2 Tax=Hymenobacter TaxID=89966 RepID=A0A7W9T3I1_9BACT|nr:MULTISPECIES: T9SS type A sorting domain-containing protein [Hymenobacter]MBB4603125.1 hypothetical protein [Hymenobacter latericoloratus]MBB6060916.1 hypothetical protein [Hymenobacter luteus]